MGRLAKKGLEYFPMDIDMFQDIRIRKLIKYQGGASVSVYTFLLCLIYKDGYYMRWDPELPFIVSEATGLEENRISEVISSCLSVGLFDKTLYEKEQILTSRSIQQRYCSIKRLNKRLARIDEYRLIDERPASTGKSQKESKNSDRMGEASAEQPSQSSQASPSLQSSDTEYLKHFFSDARKDSLTTLCENLGFKKSDTPRLRKLATEILSEWAISEMSHVDFTDFSRHLISTMRIRILGTKKNPKKNSVPLTDADYIRVIDQRRAKQTEDESSMVSPVTPSEYLASKGASSCGSIMELISDNHTKASTPHKEKQNN